MTTQDIQKLKDLATKKATDIGDLLEGFIAAGYLMCDDQGQINPTPLGYHSDFFDKTGVTIGLQIVQQTETHEVGIAYFQGNLMKFYKNIKTGQVGADVDALAKTLGFSGAHEMLSQDKTLDLLNKVNKETGVWPIQAININNSNRQWKRKHQNLSGLKP